MSQEDNNQQPQQTPAVLSLDEVENAVVPEYDAIGTGEKVAKETVVFELHIRKPGFYKSLSPSSFLARNGSAEMEPDATVTSTGEESVLDPTMLWVSQALLDKKALKDINRCDAEFSNWLWDRRIPTKMLAVGLFLIPAKSVQEIDDKYNEYLYQRKQLIDAFESKYEELKADARLRRGSYFDEQDYPPFTVLRNKFVVEARYLTLNVPAALEGINKVLFEQQKEKTKLMWADIASEGRDALRNGFAQLVNHFADRLGTDAETGKPKVFRASAVENLLNFLDMFENRNLFDDNQLANLVSQAKQMVNGVDAQGIRSNEELRANLATAFSKISEQATSMITVQERQFSLEDE